VPRILCALADLAATGAKDIALLKDGAPYSVFVIRDAAGVRAFENSCPHVRLPLNGETDIFFDVRRTVLVCVNHGAHFDPVTGVCLRGPCKGERLRAFPVTTDGESVLIP
jgi:nitrite reductase/ring-hydroxylating ferredoxin subunit